MRSSRSGTTTTSASISGATIRFRRSAFSCWRPRLHLRMDQVRVQTHDIGGSFGIKITNYPQMAVCALASRKANGAPIKWTETRSEHMTSSAHGNERTFRDTRVALDKNGVILAVDSRHIDDCGAYPRYEPLGCVIWSQVTPATYRLKNLRIDFSAGGHQQVSRWPESRLLAHAAPLVSGARHRHLRPRAEHSCRRDAPAELHSPGGISVHHAERLRLRLGQLSRDAEGGERADWLGQVAGRARRKLTRRAAGSASASEPRSTRAPTTSGSRRSSIRRRRSPATRRRPAPSSTSTAKSSSRSALCRKGQGHETTVSQVVADILNIPRIW